MGQTDSIFTVFFLFWFICSHFFIYLFHILKQALVLLISHAIFEKNFNIQSVQIFFCWFVIQIEYICLYMYVFAHLFSFHWDWYRLPMLVSDFCSICFDISLFPNIPFTTLSHFLYYKIFKMTMNPFHNVNMKKNSFISFF